MSRINQWTTNGLLAAGVPFLLLGAFIGAAAAHAGGPGVAKYDERTFEVLEESGVAVITVERSNGEDGAVTVDYRTEAISAVPGQDYDDVAGTLTWAHNDGSSRTFFVPLIDDGESEGRERVRLVLENPSGGLGLDAERAVAELVILASDGGTGGGGGGGGGDDGGGGGGGGGDDGGGGGRGTIKLGSGAFQVLEGAGPAVLRVERSQGENGRVTVDYRLAAGSATAGADYTDVAGTLSWGPGDGADKTIVVPIVDDGAAEGNESFEVLLSNPTGGAVLHPSRSQANVTILDNDAGQAACPAGDASLCLLGGRFQVEVAWRDFADRTGTGRAVALSDKSGLFWFFNRTNFEVLVKMVDACNAYGANWLFFSSTTNVEMDVTVRDTATGLSRTFHNPLGRTAEPVIDISSFTGCN